MSLLSLAVLAGCSTTVGGSPSAAGRGTGSSSEEPGGSGSGDSDFAPSEDNEDPAKAIDGVVVTEYDAVHAQPGHRVAYTKAPPDGGRHDQVWANCSGTVYRVAVRNEHMVHALEHGAVWLAYNPDDLAGDDVAALADRVDGVPYLMLSPYPGLDAPISLQAWGHQLTLSDPADPRVDQFITALRENQYTAPEPGARCDTEGTGFDVANPPPFDPTPPGPDAEPVNGP